MQTSNGKDVQIKEIEEGCEAKPDYETPCVNCGGQPTVDIVKDGAVQYHSDLCGACFYGEWKMSDPINW